MRTTEDKGALTRWHIRALALGALTCVALTACGSSANSPKSNQGPGAKGAGVGIKFSDCMRAHGLANFPDPSAGGGIQINSSSGLDPQSPAFQSAQKACSNLLPGGGPGRAQVSASRKAAMVKLAQCMRKHGLSAFPDPTATPPSPGPGGGIAFGGPGSFIAVPQSLIQSPAFNAAAAACGFPGEGKIGGAKTASPP
jgi:hypothetical protein